MFNAKGEEKYGTRIHIIRILLAISFDIWNQIKSMRIQSSLLTMNNQVNDLALNKDV